MSTEVRFNISGKAWSVISGSEIVLDAVKYDGGSVGAHDALRALSSLRAARRGRGVTYVCTTTPAGADTIADYCETVGEGFAHETERETKADGRALLDVAARIRAELDKLDAPLCEWFAMCDREATTTLLHPVIGEVPCCARCAAKATAL